LGCQQDSSASRQNDKGVILGTRNSELVVRYNIQVPETKPFRLTESVKAAG